MTNSNDISFNLLKQDYLTLGHFTKLSWKFVKENFSMISLLALCLTGVSLLIGLITLLFLSVDTVVTNSGMRIWEFRPIGESVFNWKHIIYTIVIFVVSWFLTIIFDIAFAYFMKKTVDGHSPDRLGDLLGPAMEKWGSVLSTGIIKFFVLFGWSLLLLIPGFIYSVFYMFSLYVVLFRGLTGMKALNHSKNVITNHWGKAFGYSLLFGFASAVINNQLVFGGSFISMYIGIFFQNIITLSFTIPLFLLYYNLDYMKFGSFEPEEQDIITE